MFSVFLFLFSLFMVLFPFYQLYQLISRVENAKNYKETRAVVVDARVANVTSRISMFLFSSKSFFYALSHIDGVKIGFSTATFYPFNNHHQKQLVSSLKKGDEVVIYYDPKRPYDGVLLKPSEHSYLWLALRAAFFFVTVFLGYYYYFKW
jgi:hypothetical protein